MIVLCFAKFVTKKKIEKKKLLLFWPYFLTGLEQQKTHVSVQTATSSLISLPSSSLIPFEPGTKKACSLFN